MLGTDAVGTKWPEWAAILVISVIMAVMIAFVNSADDDLVTPGEPKDVWLGRCYRCGDEVSASDAVSLHSHGKPPKHFCHGCRYAISL